MNTRLIHKPSKEIAVAIRSIRTRLGKSQAELGQLLSVTRNTVSRWERSQVVPSAERLIEFIRHAESESEFAPIMQLLGAKGIAISDLNLATPQETSGGER